MRDKGEYIVKLEKTIQMLYDWLSILREEREQRDIERKLPGYVKPESVQVESAGDVECDGNVLEDCAVPDARYQGWRRSGVFGARKSRGELGAGADLDRGAGGFDSGQGIAEIENG